MILKSSNSIPRKSLYSLVVAIKRGLSSYYLQKQGTELPFINITNIQEGKIDTRSVETVRVKENETVSKSKLEPNDVVISIKGSNFRAVVADKSTEGYLISANLIAFKLNEQILPEILAAYLNSPLGQKELQARSAGALQKALNLKSLMEIPIPIPDKKDQKAIAEYLKLSKQHQELLDKEHKIRQQLDDQIMIKYMQG